jgi:hypothetical protein
MQFRTGRLSSGLGVALIAMVSSAGCDSPLRYAGLPQIDTPADTATTHELASSNGNLLLYITVTSNVAPGAPLEFSLDGRPADQIGVSAAEVAYHADPGHHTFNMALADPGCSLTVFAPSGGVRASQNFVVDSVGAYAVIYVGIDCVSTNSRWGAKATVVGENAPATYILTLHSDAYGTRTFAIATDGNTLFGPLHVGWWHFTLTGVTDNCVVTGPGWIQPGWCCLTDSVEIKGTAGAVFYRSTCH